MAVTRKCAECGKPIDVGYIDIKAEVGELKGHQHSTRLHSNGGCLGKYRLTHFIPPESTGKV